MKPIFALLLAGVTLSTYFSGILIEKAVTDKRKSFLMYTNIILVILPLFFYKYFEALNQVFFSGLNSVGLRYVMPEISLLLPVGISFYTFMAIGYTIDVYNEDLPAEKNPGIFALFISFFPLILSGPIERAGNMLPQFNNPQRINYENIAKGLKLMLWGYFMKLVVADRLGIYVDEVYENIDLDNNGTSLLLATILYPFQVYGDLGGYSLIAIGAAKAMGFDVIQNFRRPFFSRSMSDLWRRWHISLITWITDYIYTPLSFQFRRRGKSGIVIALMIAFVISGLWHGATLAFIAWGILQGIYLSIEALTVKDRADFRKKYNLGKNALFIFSSCVLTFILFSLSQVFGRAITFEQAMVVFKKIITDGGLLPTTYSDLFIGIVFLSILMLSDFRDEFFPDKVKLFNNNNFIIRFFAYVFVFLAIIFFGVVSNQFIYFKF